MSREPGKKTSCKSETLTPAAIKYSSDMSRGIINVQILRVSAGRFMSELCLTGVTRNRILRRIFVPQRDENEEWIRLRDHSLTT